MAARKSRTGFTLVELLVVIGIIAVLMAILLPVLNRARDAAQTVACASNMRQVYMGLTHYANDWNGWVPVLLWGNGTTDHWRDAGGTNRDWVPWAMVVSGGGYYGPSYTPYLGQATPSTPTGLPGVFSCPTQVGRVATLNGAGAWTIHGRGSYAMNEYVLGNPLGSDVGSSSVKAGGAYGCYRLTKSLHSSDLFLFADAGWNSTGGQNYVAGIMDPDAVRHSQNRGLNIAYADGHVELYSILPIQWANVTWGKLPWFNR